MPGPWRSPAIISFPRGRIVVWLLFFIFFVPWGAASEESLIYSSHSGILRDRCSHTLIGSWQAWRRWMEVAVPLGYGWRLPRPHADSYLYLRSGLWDCRAVSLSLALYPSLSLSPSCILFVCIFFSSVPRRVMQFCPCNKFKFQGRGGPIVMAEGRREKAAALAVGSTPRGGIHLLPVELMAHPYISL